MVGIFRHNFVSVNQIYNCIFFLLFPTVNKWDSAQAAEINHPPAMLNVIGKNLSIRKKSQTAIFQNYNSRDHYRTSKSKTVCMYNRLYSALSLH